MSQRLFAVSKIGLFLDSITHGTEERRGEEVKIVTLTLRAQPFDATMAIALDDGIGGDSHVRSTLFKLDHPDPRPMLRRVDFALGCPRQELYVYASPDTPNASILLGQVKIGHVYARTEKNVNGFALVFRASLGPVGRAELEFVQEWLLGQKFVTFEQSEPNLFDVAADELDEADEKARAAAPTPMFDDIGADTLDGDAPRPASAPEPVRQRLRSHAEGRKRRSARQADPAPETADTLEAEGDPAPADPGAIDAIEAGDL